MTRPGWFSSFAAVFERELKGICANAQLVIFCFYVPVFWMIFVWIMLGQGAITRLPVALVDNDRSPMSREVVRAMAACPAVAFQAFAEPDTALAAMRAGSVYAVALIPAGYSRARQTGTGSSVALWLDENRFAAAGTIQAQLEGALQALNQEQMLTLALETGAGPAEARRMLAAVHADFYSLANMASNFLAFLGSTLLPGLVMIGGTLSFITAFVRELWHSSVGAWIACANGRLTAAVAGKLLPWYAVYGVIFTFYAVLFFGEGGFNINGSLLIWIALGLACLADFAAVAILITAISPTWRMALVLGVGYAAPGLPFAGFSMPLESMGSAVQHWARCLPLTWFVSGQSQEWALGTSLSGMGDTFAAMACLFIVPLCAGLPLLRRHYDRLAAQEEGAPPALTPQAAQALGEKP